MEIPQPQSNIPPVPPSPPEVEDGGTLSRDQMLQNIKGQLDKVGSRYQDFNAVKTSSDIKNKKSQGEILRQVFDLLQSVGIDPSNVEQVQEFLNKIKEENPELYTQLEQALKSIVGGEAENDGVTVDSGEIPQNLGSEMPISNMNINTNAQPQENI